MFVDVRYRGNGWPGDTVVTVRSPRGLETHALSYDEAWGTLARDKQWRCQVCADHTGEFADIAVGDPWHRPIEPGEPGRSLIVARTEHGSRLVAQAIADGHLVAERVSPTLIGTSLRASARS